MLYINNKELIKIYLKTIMITLTALIFFCRRFPYGSLYLKKNKHTHKVALMHAITLTGSDPAGIIPKRVNV